MDSPLSAIESFGSPALENLELVGSGDSTTVRGKTRQLVRFFKQTMHEYVTDKAKINPKTGDSTPISFKLVPVEREMVHIVTPGDKNEILAPAEHYHKNDHFKQYHAYRQGKAAPLGTAIDECPYLSHNLKIELKAMSIVTEEQLADCADHVCSLIPEGWELRQFAIARCNARKSQGASVAQVNVMKAELEKSQALIQEMQVQMKQMQGMLLDASGKLVAKRSRKKVEAEEVTEEI